jgi:hypothetical protein
VIQLSLVNLVAVVFAANLPLANAAEPKYDFSHGTTFGACEYDAQNALSAVEKGITRFLSSSGLKLMKSTLHLKCTPDFSPYKPVMPPNYDLQCEVDVLSQSGTSFKIQYVDSQGVTTDGFKTWPFEAWRAYDNEGNYYGPTVCWSSVQWDSISELKLVNRTTGVVVFHDSPNKSVDYVYYLGK